MKYILSALSVFFEHIYTNFSNYCLFLGLGAINYYIYISYGISKTILSIGIILVLSAVVSELNKNSRNNKRY